MIKYILLAILGWFLYKFIFRFVIPIYRSTKQVRSQFKQMQDQFRQQQEQYAQQPSQQSGSFGDFQNTVNNSSSKTSVSKDDYIDFEEVK